MRRKGVILDGDDTLWDTMPLYTAARERFLDAMAALGFSRLDVAPAFDQIDEAHVAELGFSRRRFPASMVRTYRHFCNASHAVPNRDTEESIAAIGEGVFAASIQVFQGVGGLLAMLQRSYTVILATKGDEDVQRLRIEQSGLGEYFSQVFILSEKCTESFMLIIKECHLDPASSWSVGNSLKSDIIPALEAGLRAIWIRRATWSYEHADAPDDPRLRICDHIGEVGQYLREE